jgi:Arc/MetJ-type ribon-helix-helix transcriptional regulator
MNGMKRTTITLPDELVELVEHEVRRRGTSFSEVVRWAIRETLLGGGPRELAFAGIVDDAELPAGADLEEALDEAADDLDRRG